MDYDAYFDESGDLGWILDKKFRKGGSSQFFTIAYLSYQPVESHNNKRLIFIDWVANFIWRKYEDEVEEPFQILSQSIEVKELFF